jgi:hypothetical protein
MPVLSVFGEVGGVADLGVVDGQQALSGGGVGFVLFEQDHGMHGVGGRVDLSAAGVGHALQDAAVLPVLGLVSCGVLPVLGKVVAGAGLLCGARADNLLLLLLDQIIAAFTAQLVQVHCLVGVVLPAQHDIDQHAHVLPHAQLVEVHGLADSIHGLLGIVLPAHLVEIHVLLVQAHCWVRLVVINGAGVDAQLTEAVFSITSHITGVGVVPLGSRYVVWVPAGGVVVWGLLGLVLHLGVRQGVVVVDGAELMV